MSIVSFLLVMFIIFSIILFILFMYTRRELKNRIIEIAETKRRAGINDYVVYKVKHEMKNYKKGANPYTTLRNISNVIHKVKEESENEEGKDNT